MLELLEARTQGIALEIIKNNHILTIEHSPEYALKAAWEKLDRRFHTEDRPFRQLLKEVQQGPSISAEDADSLFTLSQKCSNLSDLQGLYPTSLHILDEQATQEAIIARLHKDLSIKWYEHKQAHLSHHRTVPFHLLSRWIETRAQICLE